MTQERIQKQKRSDTGAYAQGHSDGEAAAKQDLSTAEAAVRAEKLKDDMDSILDEIDEVLEENAEEFILAFRQEGGE